MNKTKIIPANFPRKDSPAGWWFPEGSLIRLAEILLEEPADLEEGVEEKVEGPEE